MTYQSGFTKNSHKQLLLYEQDTMIAAQNWLYQDLQTFVFSAVFFSHILFVLFLCVVHQEALNKSEIDSQSNKKRLNTIQLSQDAKSYCPH